MWCGVVWCAEGVLAEGNGWDVYPRVKVNGRVVRVARAPCASVWLSSKEGKSGEPRCHPLGNSRHPRSFRSTPSLSACWCTRTSCNTHAIVLPGTRQAFGKVAHVLPWAYQTLMDSAIT